MAAGVTPKLWEMSDMVQALEEWEACKLKDDECCLRPI
jgi:hypothetical protein